jgi:hypothetical protein
MLFCFLINFLNQNCLVFGDIYTIDYNYEEINKTDYESISSSTVKWNDRC